jgi:hypothetical protein
MGAVAGSILRASLERAKAGALRAFGTGTEAPILLVDGVPKMMHLPPTPCRGFLGDDSKMNFPDMILLGIYHEMGVEPVSVAYENSGRLFRNVVPNPDSRGQKSSHGYDAELGWHSDNPCGPIEPNSLSLTEADRSSIPRFLGFEALRNTDGLGRPVPTEVLSLDAVLEYLDEQALTACAAAEFQINPPASNETNVLKQVPILTRREDRYFVRFNADSEEVFGLTAQARWGLKQFAMAARKADGESLAFELEPSMLLIFDNYRVLHRRRSFDPGADWAVARWLRRCYACHSLLNGKFVDRVHCPNLWQ